MNQVHLDEESYHLLFLTLVISKIKTKWFDWLNKVTELALCLVDSKMCSWSSCVRLFINSRLRFEAAFFSFAYCISLVVWLCCCFETCCSKFSAALPYSFLTFDISCMNSSRSASPVKDLDDLFITKKYFNYSSTPSTDRKITVFNYLTQPNMLSRHG